MKAIVRASVVTTFASALCACQTPVIQSSKASAATQSGLVYALPKAQVQLDASRTVINSDDVDKARKTATQAADAVKAAGAAETTAKAELKDAEAVLAAATTQAKPELTQKRDVADAVARVRSAQLEAAKLAQKEANKRLADLEGKEGSYEISATLKLLPAVPDTTHRYVATLNSDGTRDDNVKLTTVNGMLSSSSSESSGQVAAILVNIASAIAAAKMPTSPWKLNLLIPASPGASQCEAFATSLVFDPTDAAEVASANTILGSKSQQGLALTVSVSKAGTEKATDDVAKTGLVYRAPTPVVVNVASQAGGACKLAGAPSSTTLSATVPDSRTSYVLPVKASSFTKTKTVFEFKDGMPTSLNVDQPSQLAAISRIPIDILKAIIEVPASIIKLRVDYDSQAAALTDAEVKQVKAQLDLLNAKNALKDAQATDPK